jgi:hypothetical protein
VCVRVCMCVCVHVRQSHINYLPLQLLKYSVKAGRKKKIKKRRICTVPTTLSLKRTCFNAQESNQPTNKQTKKETQQSIVTEKLAAVQTVKKFPAFYGTLMFITLFTPASQPYV